MRDYLHSDQFPYNFAWDLKTRKLHFYLTREQAIARKEPPEVGLTNKTFVDVLKKERGEEVGPLVSLNTDFEYVAFHIIKEDEEINYLHKKTAMMPGEQVFVPERRIFELVGQKLLQVKNDKIHVENMLRDLQGSSK